MLQLKNNTPFQANIAVFPNEQGIDTLYITVKATMTVGNKIELAEAQRLVALADEYWGEPGQSSLKTASDAHLGKPFTDVLVIGEACAPDQRPMTQLDVSVAVADRKKTVRVFGDRRWETDSKITPPAKFETIPLIYERTFGGVHEVGPEKKEVLFEPRNPVGAGFIGKRTKKEIEGIALPNLEDPRELIAKPSDRPQPAGFGAIAPGWEPRKSFAGTYDAVWQKSRAPYLPQDFDRRFFNMAHPDLVCRGYLKGGEVVEVINASPRGPWRCTVPACQLEVAVRVAGKIEKPMLNLETLLIEPGASILCMTWRTSLPCDKKVLKVEQVELTLQRMDVQRTVA